MLGPGVLLGTTWQMAVGLSYLVGFLQLQTVADGALIILCTLPSAPGHGLGVG